MSRYRVLMLGLYITGIIIGGGILALPFVAMDAGLPILLVLLIIFGIVFYAAYIRILNGVAYTIRGAAKVRPGLELFDYTLEKSGLGKYGRKMFAVGLALYVVPADIVYILYGMKSMIQLSEILDVVTESILGVYGILASFCIFICSAYMARAKRRYLEPHESFIIKLLLMISLWVAGIGTIRLIENYALKVVFAVMIFCASLLIGEYFPDRVFRLSYDIYDLEDLQPKHKVGSYLTLMKIMLILSVPIIAFILMVTSGGIVTNTPLIPRSIGGVVYSTTIIIFMYVGSGVYNILVYRWISRRIELGKRAVFIAILLSMLTYIAFTLLILFSVDPEILIASDLNREHSFIALSHKLTLIGLTHLGYITILIANLFALISVAVAYMGFTETLSERIYIDTGIDMGEAWFAITFSVGIATALLEIFNVTRFATDALGIAGNAGGGMFALILPWLIKNRKGKRNVVMAIVFLLIVVILNIFLVLNSATVVAIVSAGVATILVVIFSALTLLEASKK